MIYFKSLYFNGPKHDTFKQISAHRKLTPEAHVELIRQPGSNDIGHISLMDGKSEKNSSSPN